MSDEKTGCTENRAENRLAVYGSLAPGEENHDQLAGLDGVWSRGTVRGRVFVLDEGEARGYLALVLDPAGPQVAVQVFESAELPEHWARLDAFEGRCYRRVVAQVETEAGILAACIYHLRRG